MSATFESCPDPPGLPSSWRRATDEAVEFPHLTVGDALRSAARSEPDRVALIDGRPEVSGRWTYGELLADATRVAAVLAERNRPGDRIALWAGNSPEWVILELGVALAGLVLVPINPAYRMAEATHALGVAAPSLLVHGAPLRGNDLAELATAVGRAYAIPVASLLELTGAPARKTPVALPAVEPDWPAQVQFTSGTTGPPKGAELIHRGLMGMPAMAVPMMELSPHPVWLNMMPMFHIGGCGLSTLGPIIASGTQLLLDQFDPARVLELIETEGVTVMGSVPTMLIAILETLDQGSYSVDSLEVVISGGAPVSGDLIHTIESALGARFIVAFGQTEAHGHITQTRPDDDVVDKAETVGRPLPHVEIKVVDATTGEVVPTGSTGELCTRSPLLMRGYVDQPEATAAAIDTDGYLHTGDLVRMDERGYLRIAGRAKDMICRGGENISPPEVETALEQHPHVAQAVVLGLADDRLGESVAACVRFVSGSGGDFLSLEHWLRERIAPFKVPRTWRAVEEFPMTPTGKVQRHRLLSRFEKP